VRKDAGGCIGFLAPSGSPRNLLNAWDHGRFVQQSYYGKPDGSFWGKTPWSWNPVQGGDYTGHPATLLESQNTATTFHSKTLPKHWAAGNDLPETVMESWIVLEKNCAKVRFRLAYSGAESHPPRRQELPAVFVTQSLSNLVFYAGEKPWTKDNLSHVVPGWPNEGHRIDEHWAAYVDDHDWGVGIINPQCDEITSYRFLAENAPEEASCSYLAPVKQLSVTPGFTWDYEISLLVGEVDGIRNAAYALHEAPAPAK
jgi:hypothetical protein